MAEARDAFLAKALDSLASAEIEVASGRYDNAANRCYYAGYQAAIAALEAAGIYPAAGTRARWTHEGVQSQFVGVLINRRKRYPSELRDVLSSLFALRLKADYTRNRVSEAEARRAVRRCRELVVAIQSA
jgi:uncharacterized protein (UPF0332 family)